VSERNGMLIEKRERERERNRERERRNARIERERERWDAYIYIYIERERERDGMLVGDDAELIEKSVMPNFLHVIPIVDCTRHATHKRKLF